MAGYTENYRLKKPEETDFYTVQDQNDNMDAIDRALAGDIDCGAFDEPGPVARHNHSALAHALLQVDGNMSALSPASETLEEHMADPLAHQNLKLDGNMN